MSCRPLTVRILFLMFMGLAAMEVSAQNETEKAPYLVARHELSDPVFEQSVVLMLPLTDEDEDVLIGLIVNKPSRIMLREVFPKDEALKDRSELVYFGGPVDTKEISALFRSPKPPPQAVHLSGDLYLSFDSAFIEALVKMPKEVGDIRLFLGRAQWAPEQLQNEMAGGAWYLERAEDSFLFSPDPQNVWRTLIGRQEPGTIVRRLTNNRELALDGALNFPAPALR